MQVKARQIDGVAKALNPGLDEHHKAAPVVVEKLLEDFREVASEPLGRVKTLGHGQFTSPDQVFGLPSQKGAEWGVRECIGNYSADDQAPDKDLGRSIRPGWRNTAPPARMFGVPTIRNDIPAPSLKSITDHQNYGDEAGAAKLLYPPRFSDEGISDEDFLLARSQQEIAAIFAGFGLDDDTLASTYEQARAGPREHRPAAHRQRAARSRARALACRRPRWMRTVWSRWKASGEC